MRMVFNPGGFSYGLSSSLSSWISLHNLGKCKEMCELRLFAPVPLALSAPAHLWLIRYWLQTQKNEQQDSPCFADASLDPYLAFPNHWNDISLQCLAADSSFIFTQSLRAYLLILVIIYSILASLILRRLAFFWYLFRELRASENTKFLICCLSV